MASGEYARKEQTTPIPDLDSEGSAVPLPSPARSTNEDDDELHYSLEVTLENYAAAISAYEELPTEMQQAVLAKILRATDRTTLSIMAEYIVPSLRCDFIGRLPNELVCYILQQLDFKDLCAAAQVSRTWRNNVDSQESVWKNRLLTDKYVIEPKEVKRALKEQWDYTSWGTTEGKRKPKTFNDVNAPPVNLYKAIYRRKYLIIHKNWMDPRYNPKQLSIEGNGSDVVTCLQFNDEKIITGSDDHTITVYDSQTGLQLHRLEGHDGGVWALQYVGNLLVSGSTDRTVRVWDVERGVCTHVFAGHTSTVRCLEVLLPVDMGVNSETGIRSMVPPVPLIVTGSRDTTLKVWKLPSELNGAATATNAQELGPDSEVGFFEKTLEGHQGSVRALSGHGNVVVSGSYDSTVRVWDVEAGLCTWVLTGHAQRVYSAVLDHKRNRCISGSMDWFVKVWCLETGTLLYTLEGHTSLVGLLDLNRTTLVSAAADSTLRVWDPDNGTFVHKLEGHQGAITCFQHDEYKVVSGSEHTLKLWNIQTGKPVQDLLQDLTRIWQVRFDQRKCVAAVQRDDRTFIEVLDFDYDPYDIDT